MRDLAGKQLEFVTQLSLIMRSKEFQDIVYIDETTFNLWQKMSRCWTTPDMRISLVKNRGPSITMIGGISNLRGLVHYDLINESNNSDHYEHFVISLKRKCEGMRTLIILDNLRIHHAKKV